MKKGYISRNSMRQLFKKFYPNLQLSDEALDMLCKVLEYQAVAIMGKVYNIMKLSNKSRLTRKLAVRIFDSLGIEGYTDTVIE